ncbi:hypothetical protein NL676_000802 [Syzygium grande]|nr:hypothetical protein NL676_000802 [Syzygium grande]
MLFLLVYGLCVSKSDLDAVALQICRGQGFKIWTRPWLQGLLQPWLRGLSWPWLRGFVVAMASWFQIQRRDHGSDLSRPRCAEGNSLVESEREEDDGKGHHRGVRLHDRSRRRKGTRCGNHGREVGVADGGDCAPSMADGDGGHGRVGRWPERPLTVLNTSNS